MLAAKFGHAVQLVTSNNYKPLLGGILIYHNMGLRWIGWQSCSGELESDGLGRPDDKFIGFCVGRTVIASFSSSHLVRQCSFTRICCGSFMKACCVVL